MKRKQAYLAPMCPVKSIIVLLTLFLISVFSLPASCQFFEPAEQTIGIGDTLPESFYQTPHTVVDVKAGHNTTLKLAKYRNKLIILDFWATWCGPCLQSLDKLDSIKAAINTTAFTVIPVTYQPAEKAASTFKRFGWDMVSIVGDTILSQIFPHSGIPHQVWIKDSKVLAMPHWHYATAENIEKAILEQDLNMRNSLRTANFEWPLFIDGNGGDGESLLFQSVVSHGNPEFQQHEMVFFKETKGTFLAGYNLPLSALYYSAFQAKIHPRLGQKAAIVFKINDSLLAKVTEMPPKLSAYSQLEAFQQDYNAWVKRKWYSYSLFVQQPITEAEARQMMQNDLNRFFGLHYGIEGKIEKRLVNIAVLRIKTSLNKAKEALRSKGGKPQMDLARTGNTYSVQNVGMGSFETLIGISKAAPDAAFFADSTGLPENFRIDFHFPASIQGNWESLQQELGRYGLHLNLEEKAVPKLVIRHTL